MEYIDTKKKYRYILIVDSRDRWANFNEAYDLSRDLVLTYDFALRRQITGQGGSAFYVDHLVHSNMMQENNFRTYTFFREWHLDATGADIFTYRDVPFGFAFRIEIWNDLLSYVLTRANLGCLIGLQFEQVFVGTELGLVESILNEMNFTWNSIPPPFKKSKPTYYFPIDQWMNEKVRAIHFKHKLMDGFVLVHSRVMEWINKVFFRKKDKARIFVQAYHPTRAIIENFKDDPRILVIEASFSRAFSKLYHLLSQRFIPMIGKIEDYQHEAEQLLRHFNTKRCAGLILADDSDISNAVYSVIEKRIIPRISQYLRDLNCIIHYLEANPIDLEVMISNIGRINTLVDCVCKKRNIPSFLIINGLLGPEYLDESKYATIINAYSESIKQDYFRGMDNVVCLGDPRMDNYVNSKKSKLINREFPTITIGASGFNIVDLNSYVAVEFDFLWDVLQALCNVKRKWQKVRVVIKVRSNGLIDQYRNFTKEYFPGLVDEIHDTTTIRNILEKTDLYISIHSQTLFEASCLEIPCIYYKKGTEIFNAPFDGKSELVTVDNITDLEQAIMDFYSGSERFNPFLQRVVMEKYIGHLDGASTLRNVNFIYDLLSLKPYDKQSVE